MVPSIRRTCCLVESEGKFSISLNLGSARRRPIRKATSQEDGEAEPPPCTENTQSRSGLLLVVLLGNCRNEALDMFFYQNSNRRSSKTTGVANVTLQTARKSGEEMLNLVDMKHGEQWRNNYNPFTRSTLHFSLSSPPFFISPVKFYKYFSPKRTNDVNCPESSVQRRTCSA